ncbi:MAG: DUF6263 family protein, partial [Planctomycetaceae bacterium]
MARLIRFRPQSILLSAVAAMLIAPTLDAQVVLKSKIQPNTKRVTHAENSTKQILNLNGMNIETKTTQFIIAHTSTGARAADGTVQTVEAIKKLQQELKVPGINMSFDSDDPDKQAPLPQLEPILDVLRAISKLKTTYTFNKADELVKVGGVEEALKDLDPAVRKTLDHLSPDSLKKKWQNTFDTLPAKPVQVGDKWEHTSVDVLEAGQVLTVKRQYTYTGTIEKGGITLHRVTTKSLEVSLTQDNPPEDSPRKLSEAKLKVAKGTGEFLIDVKRGLTVQATDSLQMTGPLKMEINGMS